ncbi:hypothetical protein CTAYLR_003041 [Chrysophaeum taylorii]|uniref:Glucanase n=1 Tax=Chrysophaeum taylorii TaxID=2483200 RepID=A0AAD7XGP1_9STRA|nr:hypothetical protein CTAYLR_003041 [Chrysophaeum taylorii]
MARPLTRAESSGRSLRGLVLVAASLAIIGMMVLRQVLRPAFAPTEASLNSSGLLTRRHRRKPGVRNPFAVAKTYYVQPTFADGVASSIATAAGTAKAVLEVVKTLPTAYWIDTITKVRGANTTTTMEGIMEDAPDDALVVFVVYNLPNRDCGARASSGEFCCERTASGACDLSTRENADAQCSKGLASYTAFIDDVRAVLSKKPTKRVVVILEPDSMPNIATNPIPECAGSTRAAYIQGLRYAMQQLAPVATIYLDAANSAWLGWPENMRKFAAVLNEITPTPAAYLRGFTINVANYDMLGVQCPWLSVKGMRNDFCLLTHNADHPCCLDPCGMASKDNPSNNELNYAAAFARSLTDTFPTFKPRFVIDTSRNGRTDARQDCSNWCNIKQAGLGVKPTSKTANESLVDAYFYIKTPGESDGCSRILPDGELCPRFDAMCDSIDSIADLPAPEAGVWFDYQIKSLAINAIWAPHNNNPPWIQAGLRPPKASKHDNQAADPPK